MKLKLKNIGKVKKAEIYVDGLTIITGTNDSGKTTIAKVLYSAIQIGAYSESKEEKRIERLEKSYDAFKLELDKLSLRKEDVVFFEKDVLEEFIGNAFIGDFNKNILVYKNKIESLSYPNDKIERIKMLFLQYVSRIRFYTYRGNLMMTVTSHISDEFKKEIMTRGADGFSVKLEDEINSVGWGCRSEDYKNMYYVVKEEKLQSISDVTYVESPLFVNILDILVRASMYEPERGIDGKIAYMPTVALHIKDFANKIDYLRYVADEKDVYLDEISSIIGGDFKYDENTQRLVFCQGNQKIAEGLDVLNVASGIKTFGVVQTLLKVGAIGPKKMLIWDEPENHLHPEWQVRFAELIVKLSKSGFPIVVSTHSPYFLQAIRYFSVKEDIENITNYYFLEDQDNNLSEVVDVKDDLNKVFVKLVRPLDEVMNVDLVRMNNKEMK